MAGLADFLGCVRAVDADLMASEIADAFWLAEHMERAQPIAATAAGGPLAAEPSEPLIPPESAMAPDAAAAPAAADGLTARAAAAGEGGSGGSITSDELVPVFHPDRERTGGPAAVGHPALPLAVPAPRELRRPLNLQRGLRPLIRTVRSGPATVLDEKATAELSARAGGAVMPALVPAGERWLDLALVFDTSPSMALWGNLFRELRTALDQLGAFRTVRTWRLAFDDGKPLVRAEAAWSTPRGPKELVDPTGRQAILLFTDCVADPWWPKTGPTGEMAVGETLGIWARKGPLAILQPLPRRMWARSAVPGHSLRLRSPFPGAPNSSLLTDRAGQWTGPRNQGWGRTRRDVPIPVLEIDQRWLASWSRLVSGTNSERVAVAFTGGPRPDYDPGEVTPPSPLLDPKEQADWLVGKFMSEGSPEAFRLAGLLAAAPLVLPLMRLIQRAMCVDKRPVPLAEVLLSGLLREVTPVGETTTSFAFRPHVRDVLLGTIRRSEAIRVRELVSEALRDSHVASRNGYVARIPAVPGTTGTALTTTYQVYGAIDAMVLRRIGGRYAQVVTATGQDMLPALAPAKPDVAEPTLPVEPEEMPARSGSGGPGDTDPSGRGRTAGEARATGRARRRARAGNAGRSRQWQDDLSRRAQRGAHASSLAPDREGRSEHCHAHRGCHGPRQAPEVPGRDG